MAEERLPHPNADPIAWLAALEIMFESTLVILHGGKRVTDADLVELFQHALLLSDRMFPAHAERLQPHIEQARDTVLGTCGITTEPKHG